MYQLPRFPYSYFSEEMELKLAFSGKNPGFLKAIELCLNFYMGFYFTKSVHKKIILH